MGFAVCTSVARKRKVILSMKNTMNNTASKEGKNSSEGEVVLITNEKVDVAETAATRVLILRILVMFWRMHEGVIENELNTARKCPNMTEPSTEEVQVDDLLLEFLNDLPKRSLPLLQMVFLL